MCVSSSGSVSSPERESVCVCGLQGLHQFDPQGKEAEVVERELGVRVIRHAQKKPLGYVTGL